MAEGAEDVVARELEPYRRSFTFGDLGPGTETAADLLRPAALEAAVDRFSGAHPGAGRRALSSLWSQWYFGTLVPAATVHALGAGRRLVLDPDRVGLRLHPTRGHVTAVRVPHPGPGTNGSDAPVRDHGGGPAATPEAAAFELLEPLVFGHLQPAVETIARHRGVPRRVLWGNAAVYLDWSLRRLAPLLRQPGVSRWPEGIFQRDHWPDGRPNPLAGTMRPPAPRGTEPRPCRTTCCLRHRIPDMDRCAGVCPADAVRRRATRGEPVRDGARNGA